MRELEVVIVDVVSVSGEVIGSQGGKEGFGSSEEKMSSSMLRGLIAATQSM
jgi:hypothetical protein